MEQKLWCPRLSPRQMLPTCPVYRAIGPSRTKVLQGHLQGTPYWKKMPLGPRCPAGGGTRGCQRRLTDHRATRFVPQRITYPPSVRAHFTTFTTTPYLGKKRRQRSLRPPAPPAHCPRASCHYPQAGSTAGTGEQTHRGNRLARGVRARIATRSTSSRWQGDCWGRREVGLGASPPFG